MDRDKPGVESIFLKAAEKPTAEERSAYLDNACGADAELRQRIERLLAAQPKVSSFLECPALGLPSPLRGSAPGHRDGGEGVLATIDEPISERPGTVIGPYKLLEQIGEGGFGVVFMAEQQQPIRRKVALKVLKPGMDTRQVVARFEAERQALALMDHPNIARVIDGGETASGRPYFVMELVRGTPITEFCDQNHLSVRDRLELFIHVCQAVQHAHQKGIIHRDLKPSNVMVTMHDDKPVTKIIDFGIAKAAGQQLTDKTLFTNFAQLLGTPLYMSPEQAGQSSLDADTRSDIYSLGVLLYELLTGTTPFDKERLRTAAYEEMRRIIREEEPPKPSTRMSTLGQAGTSISTQRQSDPKRLGQLFRGELDWIVMKCLEKNRNRRYETASALTADLQRFLNDEPILACPPSKWYRFRKLARRYRAALATAALVLLVLVAGVVVSAWQAIRASNALGQVKDQRDEAEANFRMARQAVDEQFTLVSESKLFDAPGFQPLRKDLLESALKYYLDFLRQRPDDPELQAEVAAAYLRLYAIYPMIYTYETADAIKALEKGIQIVENLLRDHPNDAAIYKRLAGFAKGTRLLHRLIRNPHPYEPDPLGGRRLLLKRAVRIWEDLVRDNPTEIGFQIDLCHIYVSVCRNEEPADGLAILRKLHQTREKIAREYPNVPEYRADLAWTHDYLAACLCLARADRPEEVENHYRQSLELRKKLANECPRVPEYRAMVAESYTNLGSWLSDNGRLPEAEQAHRRALILYEKLVTEFPDMPFYRSELAFTDDSLGRLFRDSRRIDEATEAYRQALAIWENLAKESPTIVSYRLTLALSCFSLGPLLAASGRAQEADQVYRKALEFTPDGPDALNLQAALLLICPEPKFRDPSRSLELAKKALELEANDGQIWNTLGLVHYRLGNWKDAVAALEKSMELFKGREESFNTFFLAMARWQLGDKEQARKWYDQAVQKMEQSTLSEPRPMLAELRRELRSYRAEAAKLLGIKDQPTAKEKEKPDVKGPRR